MRRTIGILAVLCLAPGLASAAPLLTLTDYPVAPVASGSSLTLTIRLSGVTDLYSYTIPLYVDGPAGSTPGVSFDFSPLPPLASTDYVFGSTATGNYSASSDASISGFPLREQLTVGDYLTGPSGVNTGAGNDVIAVVTVSTALGFTGVLNFFLSTDSPFELLDSNLDNIPGTTLGSPVSVTVVAAAVPEPSTVALALGGLASLGGVQALRRRRGGR